MLAQGVVREPVFRGHESYCYAVVKIPGLIRLGAFGVGHHPLNGGFEHVRPVRNVRTLVRVIVGMAVAGLDEAVSISIHGLGEGGCVGGCVRNARFRVEVSAERVHLLPNGVLRLVRISSDTVLVLNF